MPTFVVTYTYSPDSERLDAVRPEHRAFLGALHDAGSVVVSGPMPATEDAAAGALIVVAADDAAAAAALLDDDPFRRSGLVTNLTVREWVPVIGTLGG
ncbi:MULTISPECIES: YciI family protein [unclassified Isoptericola]|uniref:YciI family protein n=1 Tax=unclassified Isoptericola TaxID=2623355 RepID=UPI002712EFEC|nr:MULTISPECIES: YciI family protein [unclassified Isoptericola]MDO8144958.1 YciI family protein [Isoptericola sp. 178]MDO8148591.1 YciI family protein [Isoptericola sp. b515]MDO8151463.1 YciI family protein [Isoptericola sp. b408]